MISELAFAFVLGTVATVWAEKFLDRADIVAPSSGCVTDEWLLRVNMRHSPGVPPTSGAEGKADEISTKTDIGTHAA